MQCRILRRTWLSAHQEWVSFKNEWSAIYESQVGLFTKLKPLLVWLNKKQPVQTVFIQRATSKHPVSFRKWRFGSAGIVSLSSKPTWWVSGLGKSVTPTKIKHYCKGHLLPAVWCIYDKRGNSPTMICKWNRVTIGIFSPFLLHQMKPASKICTV